MVFKKILTPFLLAYLFLFISSEIAYSQDPPTPTTTPFAIRYSCLNIDWCAPEKPGNEKCVNKSGDVKDWHRTRLTQNNNIEGGSFDSSKTFVVECFSITTSGAVGKICTTGNIDLDKLGGFALSNTGPSNYERLKDLIKYASNGNETEVFDTTGGSAVKLDLNNIKPFSIGQNGKLRVNNTDSANTSLQWYSYTPDQITRSFAIVTLLNEPPSAPPPGSGGLQQGNLTFGEQCGSVNYDPLGYAYDTQTGDPVPDVDINVEYSQTQGGIFEEATEGFEAENTLPPGTLPIITNSSGFYQFFGRVGWYKMMLSSLTHSHMAQTDVGEISEVAKSLYPQNLNYFMGTSYYEGRELKTLHLPMRLIPGQNSQHVLKIQSAEIFTNGKNMQIKAQTTGPARVIIEACLTQNGVKNCDPVRILEPGRGAPVPANYFRFNTTLDQSLLQPGQVYEFRLEKITATAPPASPLSKIINYFFDTFFKQVNAQENTATFSIAPIPSYLEGYLYDSNGNVMINTDFGVYVDYNQNPYFTAKTNNLGFFRITSEFLPDSNYEIRFNKPNEATTTKITTNQFLAQNKEFLEVERVNPYIETTVGRNPRRDVTPQFTPRPTNGTIQQNQPTDSTAQIEPQPDISPIDTNSNQQNQRNILALIAVIILLVILSVGAVVYFIKKRAKNAEEQTEL